MRCALFCVLLFGAATGTWWSLQSTDIDSNLRGVSVAVDSTGANKSIVWVSGSNGAVLRSTDSGKHWTRLHIPDGDALDFRGVQAIGADVAYVMSSGEGEKSRIYKTTNGGKTWQLQYTDHRKPFFLDALVCAARCFALSDPIDGKFLVLQSEDGQHWTELPGDHMPAALPNEGAFAASNSSLIMDYDQRALYFATGGPKARVFRSSDLGKTWSVSETPILSGKASAGIFSIALRGADLVAVGGDYQDPSGAFKNAAISHDRGETWQLAAAPPGGYRSAVALYDAGYVTVGPNGTEISRDGLHWTHTDSINLNAVCYENGEGWAVGPKGTVAHFVDHNKYEIRNLEPAPESSGPGKSDVLSLQRKIAP
jgi:photosystem II stability/assembly factor-like uncharacterized protein